ncbi:MAG TPA: PAS domain-containing sensor histidine kinase, partial [Actinomycetota bacterium]|nr:PAS domain-containing sensor histidine kinase [Actinomycetota bacterium]
WIILLFLLLIAAIVGFNARATASERDTVLTINVAARQQALAERYIKDVLLTVEGFPADPQQDATMLADTALALLQGGEVLAVQGADTTVLIQPVQSDWRSVAKLQQAGKLIDKLIATGDSLLVLSRDDPGFDQQLLQLRIVGAQVSSITNDAVGEMTHQAQASLWHLVRIGVGLGLIGAVAAIAMALFLRRAGIQQSAQFRSLVQNASDLVTVLDGAGKVQYQSASAESILGVPSSEFLGRNISELVHADDAEAVSETIQDLLGRPGATARIEYRLVGADGAPRHVESAVTNLLSEPAVQGLVLNTRDMTKRHEADEKLRQLQDERSGLLQQTVHATELERKRVAAELHDGPVQHLTAFDVRLESLRARVERADTAGAAGLLDQLQERLRKEVQELRKMLVGLRPPMLDERGLPAALLEHLTAVERDAGIRCSLESALDTRLSLAQEVILYRVAQEALTNVAKHARASHVWVSLGESDGRVTLLVRDDGVGFDPSRVAESTRNGHFGLLGMRERVEMAGGTWAVAAGPDGGTLVSADVPREVGAS